MKCLYYMIKGLFYSMLCIFGIFLLFWAFHSWNQPIQVLLRNAPDSQVLKDEEYSIPTQPNRIYRDIILNTGRSGLAHFTVSQPKDNNLKNLPIIFMIDGLDTGRNCLNYIKDQTGYILVAYEYPQVIRKAKQYTAFLYIRRIRDNVLNIPAQLVSIVKWMKRDTPSSVATLSMSFGTFFTPAMMHIARIQNVELGPTILAFGGANLFHIFYENIDAPKPIRGTLAFLASILFRPIEPTLHCPHIKGDFLVVNGLYDETIPKISQNELFKSIPNPKSVINIQMEHIDPEKKEGVDRLIDISKKWLQNKSKASK